MMRDGETGVRPASTTLIAFAIVVVVVGTVSWLYSQRLACRFAEEQLETRLGSEARVGSVGFSWRGITLGDVEVEKSGKKIRIDSLVVDSALLPMVFGERRIPERVTLTGIDVVWSEEEEPIAGPATMSAPAGGSPASSPLHWLAAKRIDAVSVIAGRVRDELPPDSRVRIEDLGVVATAGDVEPLLRVAEAELHRDGAALVLEGDAALGSGERLEGVLRFDDDEPPSGAITMTSVRLSSLPVVLPLAPWHRPEDTRLDGRLDFIAGTDGTLVVEGDVEARAVGLEAAYLAEQPVVFDLALTGRAMWNGERLHIESSRIRTGRGTAQLSGDVRLSEERYELDVRLDIPTQSCTDAMSAVPPRLMGRYQGFDWEGSFGGELRLELDTDDPDATRLELDIDNACRFVTAPRAASLSRFRRPFEHRVRGRDGVILTFETGPGSGRWTPVSETNPFLIHAILAHEDATFFRHRGFATFAIETALERNLEKGRFAYGASTISMQLAKNLFLDRDKSVGRKVREVFLTWWLESNLSKEQILELYINVIEYGPEIYGIQDASRHYFGRRPAELSGAEAAFLATILPSPRSYHAQYLRGVPSQSTKQQVATLLRHMHQRERIDDAAFSNAMLDLEHMTFHRGRYLRPYVRRYQGALAPLPISPSP